MALKPKSQDLFNIFNDFVYLHLKEKLIGEEEKKGEKSICLYGTEIAHAEGIASSFTTFPLYSMLKQY